MKTELIENGNLTSQLTILIEPDDYKDDFKKELKKYGQKAQLKGFRKGKVPLTAIKKMYGKSVLADLINNKIESTLQKVITDNTLDLLGSPIPSEDQKMINFDLKISEPYEFKFDLGVAPAFEVAGVDTSASYESYKIQIDEKDIDQQIVDLQKRMGEQVEVEEPIDTLDILSLHIIEVNPVTESPFTADITIMPDRMTDVYKEEYLGKTIGYKGQVDIFQFEKEASKEHVLKYFLKDAPEDVTEMFDVEVKSIKRLIPASLDDEFFTKAFGDETIKDETSAREKLREDLAKFYEAQGLSITKRYVLETLINENDLELPDEFLKRWLLVTNEQLTAEQVEEEYGDFVKNLRWTLIKKELSKKYEIKVGPEEIRSAMIEKFKAQFAQYGYGGAMGEMDYEGIGDRMMQNQESVQKEYEELLAEGVLDNILKEVTLVEKEVSSEEYKKIVEDLRQNNN